MKPRIETKSVKHTFTTDEVNQLNVDFRQSYSNLKAVESEFDNVKAVWKSKTTEAESRMETLSATLQAGFEMRQERCRVVLDPKQSKKFFYLETAAQDADPVLTEAMTEADFQTELLEAESKFDAREDIELFAPVNGDSGVMTVGRLDKKWFAALKVKIGTRIISERLDSEQTCSKKRSVMIERCLGRLNTWLKENLGHEEAKGFQNSLALVKAAHAEREE